MSTNLPFHLFWHDHGVDRGLKNTAQGAGKAHSSFKALKIMGAAALAAIGVAAVKFGTSSVREFANAEESQKKLAFAFEKFPKLSDTNQAALQKLNSALQKKTRHDDDAIASGQALLAQFGLTGKQLTEVTPLLLDYASRTGKTVPDAAKSFGKAMLGNVRALKDLGIKYVSTGDATKDYANITKLMREKVGGFAEKEGKTASGRLEIMKNQYGEIKEAVGSKLLPALSSIVTGLSAVIGLVDKNKAVFQTFSKTVKIVFGVFTEAIGLGKGSFKDFSNFIATHQEDITRGILIGGKIALKFAEALVILGAAGLRSFGVIAGALADYLEFSTRAFGDILRAASLSMGWIPGIGEKIKGAERAFSGFRSTAVEGLRGAARGAESAAGKLEGVFIPAIRNAQGKLDALGKTEISKARFRDSAKKAAIAISSMGEAADGSKTKIRKWSDVTGSSSDKAKDLRARVRSASNALGDMVGAAKDNGASQKTLTGLWKKGEDALAKEFRQMGLSKNESRALARKYVEAAQSSSKFSGATDKQKQAQANHRAAMALAKSESNRLRDQHDRTRGGTDRLTTRTNVGKTSIQNAGGAMRGTAGQSRGLAGAIQAIRSKSVFLNFTSNAKTLAGKLGIKLARGGPVQGWGGPTDDQVPAWLSNGEFVINAKQTRKNRKLLEMINSGKEGLPPSEDQGGMRIPRFAGGGIVDMTVQKLPAAATSFPSKIGNLFATIQDKIKNSFIGKVGARLKSLAETLIAKLFSAMGGGGVVTSGPGWGPVFAAMRAQGARSFTTYPGHHPSQQRARDVTPHSWAIANAARRLSSVWYVIYRMRIASMTRANKAWLPYRPSNFRGDWRHVRHVHVALRDRGGMLDSGGFAYNGSGGPERILSPRETRSFETLVKNSARGGGGGNTYITMNAPNYVGSKDELVRALVDANRRGQLEVIKKR